MSDKDVVSLIAKVVLDLGYRSQAEDNRVLTSVSGTKTAINWVEPGSLQFSAGILAIPSSFGLEQVNEYNRQYRFASIYLNPDGSLVLQSDFLFDPEHSDHADQLEKMLGLFEACSTELRQALFAVSEDDQAGGDDA